MPTWNHDEIDFNYRASGGGLPFVFQHGLGGDIEQPLGLLRPSDGIRLIAMDFRAHGRTDPVGPHDKIGIASYADDIVALMDHLGIGSAAVGGISLGAAVALNLALRYPRRLLGLVLVRPAWLAGPNERNARLFGQVAQHIRAHGPQAGRELFAATGDYRRVLRESPDCAQALLKQFDDPRTAERVVRLERLPRESPCDDLAAVESIHVPTLVLASRRDVIHPFEYGRRLAERIKDATFREVTPKSVDLDRYGRDVRECVEGFIDTHFLKAA